MDKPKRKYVRKPKPEKIKMSAECHKKIDEALEKAYEEAYEKKMNLKINIPPAKNIEILDKYPDITDIEHPELRDKILNVLNGIF